MKPSHKNIIELQQLSMSYRDGGVEHVIFQGLNAVVKQGEFLVLLGRSGSGKSTLLNLISGIDLPCSGDIHVHGNCVNRQSERQRTLFRRRYIGFVYQSFNLIPTLTVEENVLLPLELNNRLDARYRAKALGLLEQFGLADRCGSFPDRLSGGEQQRVAIARAIVHDPLVILADEPTGNLDLETGGEVLSILGAAVREQGKTLVIATHSQEVVGLADRVMTIKAGELVASEPS